MLTFLNENRNNNAQEILPQYMLVREAKCNNQDGIAIN